MRIYIIEDDENICSLMKDYLEKYDYRIRIVDDYDGVSDEVEEFDPHLILLDLGLPKYDGFHYCRKIREKTNVPIVIISGREEDHQQIRALDLGADDYITKPFTLERLHSKIKAMLRRSYGELSKKEETSKDFWIDRSRMMVCSREGEQELTKSEFKIFSILYENMGKIIERSRIIDELWENSMFVEDNTLTVNITRIKKKLEKISIHGCIKNKRGVGYILDTEEV